MMHGISDMIENIKLQNLLPRVFRGMEDFDRIRESEVWLKDSLILERGCRVCISAESGSGKSSLLSFIYGNRTDYDGHIFLGNKDISTFSIDDWCGLRRSALALLPQELRLFPELTVIENIQIKNRLTLHKSERQIMEMLEQLGVAEKCATPVGLLSIGQQQRVALVRSICQPFDFIFLDEPVSHLDAVNNKMVARLIEEEAAAQGAGIVATSVGHHLMLSDAKFIAL